MPIYIGNDLEDRLEALETENASLQKYNEYHHVVHEINPISTGLFCLVVALGGGCFPPPSITPLSLKLDCSNFVQSYFEIG